MADNNNIDDLLQRWTMGSLSDEDFKSAIGEDEYQKYKSILGAVDNWTPSLKDEVLDTTKLKKAVKQGKQVSLSSRNYFSIAASIALIIGIGMFFFNSGSSVSSDIGQISEVILPDGKSKVILSPNSEISWNKGDWESGSRNVSLKGKAHFIVEKGDPFIVHTSIGTVEVLGTTFDVAEYGETLDLACYTGHIKGTIGDDQHIQIVAPRRATYTRGKWSRITGVSESKPVWTGDQTKYTNSPLSVVMRDLSDRYGIKVEYLEKHKNRRFTGTIPNDNLENCLKLVLIPLNIKYKVENKTVFLLN